MIECISHPYCDEGVNSKLGNQLDIFLRDIKPIMILGILRKRSKVCFDLTVMRKIKSKKDKSQ